MSAVWDIRCNADYYANPTILIKFMKKYCKKWGFQYEKSEEGYEHWQGRISLTKKVTDKFPIIDMFKSLDIKAPNYIRPTADENYRKGNLFYSYITKEESRLYGPWTDKKHDNIPFKNNIDIDYDEYFNDITNFIPYDLENIRYNNLYPYQKDIIHSGLPKNRDQRKIDLLISNVGHEGRSTISNFIDITSQGIELPALDDCDRIIATLCNDLSNTSNRDPKIILFDLPRAQTKKNLKNLIITLEIIKKGKVYDTRHNSKKWRFHPPRIWVFTNELLNLDYLSADRWNIWCLNKNKELIKYDDNDNDEIKFIDDNTNNIPCTIKHDIDIDWSDDDNEYD